MAEWLMVAVMGISGILFAAGGTDIPGIGGQKWIRRFILPFAVSLICFFAGFAPYRCIILLVLLSASLHLGYGTKVPYWRKILTFCSYSIATLALGFSYWQILSPILITLIFWLSNQKWSSNTFVWKIAEYLIGSLIGITIAHLISQIY